MGALRKESLDINGIILNLVSYRFCQGQLEQIPTDLKASCMCIHLAIMASDADTHEMKAKLGKEEWLELNCNDLRNKIMLFQFRTPGYQEDFEQLYSTLELISRTIKSE